MLYECSKLNVVEGIELHINWKWCQVYFDCEKKKQRKNIVLVFTRLMCMYAKFYVFSSAAEFWTDIGGINNWILIQRRAEKENLSN